jgi:hypothetical protein
MKELLYRESAPGLAPARSIGDIGKVAGRQDSSSCAHINLLINGWLSPITSATSLPAISPYRPLFSIAITHVYYHNDAILRVHDLRLYI